MLGDFCYYNPTKLYFGENSLANLKGELEKYGKNVLFVYGCGSIKKHGLYDRILAILAEAGKNVAEIADVTPNPTIEKLREGIAVARENRSEFVLAVGGGSVCDYSKALAASVNCGDDPWEKYFVRFEEPDCEVLPVGCVLTMTGTGSEMNGGSVITNHKAKLKVGHVFSTEYAPRFAILDPRQTMTLPKAQTIAGIYDIFNHICEQYFSGNDDNTSDYISEGLMRGLIRASRVVIKEPKNYEARSNIMWTATWALNTLISRGKTEDWMVHMLGQAVGAYTDATHGMTLSAVSLPYYRYIAPFGLKKFARFAREVWGIAPEEKSDLDLAEEGLSAMEDWMKELGLVTRISKLGVTNDMIEGIADATFILEGGYKVLTREDVIRILKASM